MFGLETIEIFLFCTKIIVIIKVVFKNSNSLKNKDEMTKIEELIV